MPNGALAVHAGEVFKEPLPPQCPPADAPVADGRNVLRLIEAPDKISAASFHSHAKLGKKVPPTVCPCRWASCSTFNAEAKPHYLTGATKLPKLRHMKYVAVLHLPPEAGRIKVDQNGHVDVWMYSDFDPLENVVTYKEVGR